MYTGVTCSLGEAAINLLTHLSIYFPSSLAVYSIRIIQAYLSRSAS